VRDVQPLFDHHGPAAISALFRVVNQYVGNLRPMPGVFPDYKAPIVRTGSEGRELARARWGMPSPSKVLTDATRKRAEKLQAKAKAVDFKELLRMEPDGGTTNICNVKSRHWTRWLEPEHRCLCRSTRSASSTRPKAVTSGLRWTKPGRSPASPASGPTGPRKVKGETNNDLHAFLTTERGGRRSSSQGDAGHPDNGRRGRDLDDCARRRGTQIAASTYGQRATIVARGVKEDIANSGSTG